MTDRCKADNEKPPNGIANEGLVGNQVSHHLFTGIC